LKVRSVKAFGIKCPEPNDNGNIRNTVVVRIETDEGIVGWGEGITMWPEATEAVVTLIHKGIKDLIVGCDPLQTEKLWIKMREHVWWYGVGGLASIAISAIDIALWDIKGKATGLPLYQLFGGKVWERLPACASIHGKHESPEENAEEIAGYIEQGFQSVKVGFGKKGLARLGQDAEYDISFVKEVRKRIGMEKGFILDIGNNVRWDTVHAIKMTRIFEEYNIMWLEEPFHPNNIDAHKELRQATNMLIGTGEREWNVEGYNRLLKTGVVDIVGIDPARMEGITAFLKVINLVEVEKKKFNAHAWSTAITSAASIHLSISSQHCLLMELKPLPNPMQNELVKNPIEQKNGWVFAPEGGGLGIEVDESAVKRFQFV
jgi:L-alanine-DL-glutamate epimerase-like enolase superfamily enzyme